MAITDPLLLPKDVILVPVTDLPEELRRQLEHDPGDWAITRPRSRAPSRIVDADSAELLGWFKEPRTIVDAVIRFSRERAIDPQETLEQAYPLLQRLVGSGFLVTEGEEDAQGIRLSLEPGAEIAGFEVVDNVQVLEDTELHQVRRGDLTAALKIERPGTAGKKTADLYAREAAILKHLDGEGAPRLLAEGEADGRRYLALEWCPGVDATTAAAELRRRSRSRLLGLCRAVARAYARLHERGVVHGDVHPRNVLVTREGEVRLIDFGIARWNGASGRLAHPWRGGVAFFFEPEYAEAVRAEQPPPDASFTGEQYGVAALLYLLATGTHPRDFSLEREEMMRQVAEEPPLPFASRGVDPWPELEEILGRALSKDPGERYPSVAAFVETLDRIPEPSAPARGRTADAAADALLGRVLERVAPGGPLWKDGLPEAPRGSVNYGAAGIAYTLYRIALAREDAALLSAADLWAARALRGVGSEESFYNPEIEITPETVGRVSPYHTANGLFSVQALVSHALGDPATHREAVAAFISGGRERCDSPDVTLGRSGVLLAASLLLETLGEKEDDPVRRELAALGDELLAGLWGELDRLPPVPVCDPLPNLGMAHGWAGYLYATLRWCRAAGKPHPEPLRKRLAELGECAQTWGRGLRWRWYGIEAGDRHGTRVMPGWCNGSAGFVFLWTLAHRELGDPAFADLALGAAWNTWEAPDGGGSLCCGLGGRAYALLNLHRHGGGPEWLERARELANRAAVDIVQGSEREDSLYKGTVGVALLAAEIARPEAAAMPFFEEEGWR
ncbi:MAG TPA: lanthionine synthetase LanC family protein [Thermoanaerobaculia bacterium]|nr:lanthionine synthetase LanC family protein [Thermoanaerobaculia bacterium]